MLEGYQPDLASFVRSPGSRCPRVFNVIALCWMSSNIFDKSCLSTSVDYCFVRDNSQLILDRFKASIVCLPFILLSTWATERGCCQQSHLSNMLNRVFILNLMFYIHQSNSPTVINTLDRQI